MRDIKFRAWHSLHKEMVYFDKEKLCKDNYQQQHLCNLMRGDHGDVLMQFTGLQDKNGVDIYEGDVVNSSGNNSLYVISFGLHSLTGFYYDEEVSCTGFFCSRQGIYSDDIESLCNKSNIYLEVIGNIHENPELLSANHE